MQYLTLNDNRKIPALGLGTWKSRPDEVYLAVKEAISIGYRHIDCAPAYENENEVGRAVAEALQEGTVNRDELWLTSKLWNNAHEPHQVRPALEKTLQDLQVEYLDLYLIHWPVAFSSEVFFPRSAADYIPLDQLPISVTWEALEECVNQGLVKHIGVCNFSTTRLETLNQTASIKPVMNQIELHPYLQQPAMLEYCRKNDVLLTAYSPLGSGDRPARLKKSDEPILLHDPVITGIARKHGVGAGEILIAWALARGTVVIPKSTNPERLLQNFRAADVQLDQEDMQAIEALDRAYRFVDGSFFTGPGSPYTVADFWD